MTVYAFTPPPPVTARIAGSDALFPVRRIYCVGRNYAAHAREMGYDPDREPPFFFGKPADSLQPGTAAVPFPPATHDFHHEVELVVALKSGGRDIPTEEAESSIFGYGIGIDWTRRDLQAEAKSQGKPWDSAKGFDHSATLGPLHPVSAVGHPARGRIWLSVNGALRQDADLSTLIWSVPEVNASLSRLFEVRPGDLIYTGTPAGVGAVQRGDRISCGIEGRGGISTAVV
ncbi:MAG: fumarylacetoacetate hydrolase family protein [Gemmatimonadota bacterium]